MRDWAPLAVIGALFITFCVFFNQATPYRKEGVLLHQFKDGKPASAPDIGAPDERQHANYVGYLLEAKGIPVFNPQDPNLYESYQAHQPPTYYLIAAGWCKVFGIDPKSESGAGLRLLNALIGLATIIALGLGGRWAFGHWRYGYTAAAFSLVPMNVALHSAVSNDPLLICLCTWVLALLALGQSDGWTLKRVVVTSVLAGLAFLTKTTAIALLPCLMLAVLFGTTAEKNYKNWKPILVGLPLLIGMPWFLRNMQLYGDPLAMNAFKQAFTGSPQASDYIAAIGPLAYWSDMVLWWTARSLVGVFGYMDIFLFEQLKSDKSTSLYMALLFLGVVSWIAGLYALLSKKSEVSVERPTKIIWGVFAFLVAGLFIRFNMQYFQGQARYLYPALGPAAWCAGAGMCLIFKKKPGISWIAVTLALTILDWSSYIQIVDGFARRVSP